MCRRCDNLWPHRQASFALETGQGLGPSSGQLAAEFGGAAAEISPGGAPRSGCATGPRNSGQTQRLTNCRTCDNQITRGFFHETYAQENWTKVAKCFYFLRCSRNIIDGAATYGHTGRGGDFVASPLRLLQWTPRAEAPNVAAEEQARVVVVAPYSRQVELVTTNTLPK